MADILCSNGSYAGWRDENNTAGLYKFMKTGSGEGWRLGQDSGTYKFRDGGNVGWRYKVFTTPLGSMAIGSTIKVPITGGSQDCIVVHHGRPSTAYDSTFDSGTILMAKGGAGTQWGAAVSNLLEYRNSTLFNFLNTTYYNNTLDPTFRNSIRQVNLPSGYVTNTSAGVQTAAVKVFAPAAKEVGATDAILGNLGSGYSIIYNPNDGDTWSYFQTNIGTSADSWTRTPTWRQATGGSSSFNAYYYRTTGGAGWVAGSLTASYYTLPSFVLPDTMQVNLDGTLVY